MHIFNFISIPHKLHLYIYLSFMDINDTYPMSKITGTYFEYIIHITFYILLYGYGSINGSGSFRDDPDVWNDHFRKMSFPHVWNGMPGIMIIISYTT